ncbi:MAG: hypothetical protein R2777_04335 [Chitinophagales bacterium]
MTNVPQEAGPIPATMSGCPKEEVVVVEPTKPVELPQPSYLYRAN